MQKIWYEVFISNEEGTRTLEICENPKEAREFKKQFMTKWNKENPIEALDFTLHIDQWENIDNPRCIGDIV